MNQSNGALARSLVGIAGGVRLAGLRGGKALAVVAVPEYRRAARFGVAPSIEHTLVPFRADYSTIVDAGAARGQFALFARRRYPQARIVCFEPLTEAHAVLSRLFAQDMRVEVNKLALSAESGEQILHVAGHDDSSSLLHIGERQEREYPGTGEVREQLVPIRRLDEVLTGLVGPALLKIDVQGGELDVLRGAGKLLNRFDDVFVECSFTELYANQPLAADVLALLFQRGFGLAGVFGVARGDGGECLQADFLLRRTESD